MSQSFDAQPPRDPRLQQMLDRAATDMPFRGRLLAEPHAAIRDTFGVQIPGGCRFKFIERDADADAGVDVLITLPPATRAPARAEGELDEAALETVAGGWGEWDGGSSQSQAAPDGEWQPDTWR